MRVVWAAWAALTLVPQDDSEVRVREFIEELGNPDVTAREQAAEALYAIGPKAVPFLKRVASKDPEVTSRVRSLLERIPWKAAEEKWARFSAEHLDRMKAIDIKTPRAKQADYRFEMHWRRLESPAYGKWFPDHRFYFDTRFLFALRQDGHIICLGPSLPGGTPPPAAPDLELRTGSDFLKSFSIKIPDDHTAREMVRLYYLTDVDFSWQPRFVSDEEWSSHLKSWRYDVSGQGYGFLVEQRYAGSGGSTSRPEKWKVLLGKDQVLVGLERFR